MNANSPVQTPEQNFEHLVPPPLRPEIERRRQRYLGREFVIVKNPLSLGYFRLPLAYAEAAEMFDGRTTIGAIVDSLRNKSRFWRGMPREQAVEELASLARQLGLGGLVKVRGASAVQRARHLKSMKAKRRFEMSVGKLLYFRKSLCDPDELLNRITPWFNWVFTRTTAVLFTLFVIASILLVIWNWQDVAVHRANFFTLQNLGLSWVIFFAVKIVHEFGHAITCKRFGGEVHEMGFMFILFAPFLFCNVTDSWMAKKSHRILIGAAGILVELFIACVAAWLWVITQPGLFNQICFNTMFLCSVSTIFFNANPLMKFDGYYIVTDALEIPNLRQKSNQYVTHWAQRWLLGIKDAPSRLASFEVNPLFGVYAVAAYCYGWFIVFNISVMMFDMLEPYGLQFFSRTYVALFLFTSLALPIYRLMKSLRESGMLQKAVIPRVRIGLIVLLIVAAGVAMLPWNETIKRSAAIEHGAIEIISATTPGFLREIHVQEGDRVEPGQLLGRLENIDIETERRDVLLEMEANEVRRREAMTSENPDARLTLGAFQKIQAELEEKLRGIDEKIATMELRATRPGVVRTRRTSDLIGQFFLAGQPILEIGDDSSLRAIIALDEKQARRIATGQPVAVRLRSSSAEILHGSITKLPISQLDRITVPSLSNLIGGDVPSQEHIQEHHHEFLPTTPHYEAEAILNLPPGENIVLHPHMTGRARITVQKTTLGRWLWHRLLEAIDPGVRL